MNTLLAVGLGYSAKVLAARLSEQGWQVIGTGRSAPALEAIAQAGFRPVPFNGDAPSPELAQAIATTTHLLVSAGPDRDGDPLLRHHGHDLAAAPALRCVGYLSTVGVYGDHGGAWVDETTPPQPVSARGRARLAAERAWSAFADETGRDVMIFRLGGIYGPGRGPLAKLRMGKAHRIIKPGQVFNRIHVEDIANVLIAAITAHDAGRLTPQRGRVYNVVDDEPAPPQDVIAFAAHLLGQAPPPEIAFAEADLPAMARSFYGENKRVSNARIKHELGAILAFPTYREGLRALAGDR